MTSTKAIKSRIKSVKNTSQITKAMEVVSATKMRKAQEFAIRARPFAVASIEMLGNLMSRTETRPKLLESRLVKKSLLLVVTADKGLAGAFNSNVLKAAETWIRAKEIDTRPYTLIAVGKKAKEYCERRKKPMQEHFVKFGDYAHLDETLPVAETVIQGFVLGAWDEADAVYTHFRTTLKQETILKKILPVTKEGIEDIVRAIVPEYGKFSEIENENHPQLRYSYEYVFEPSAEAILNDLVPQLLRMQIHHIILESNASEHSARMVAMKSASDNARDLMGDLTLEYNKSRQAGITRELTEITAGREALEG